MEDFKIRDLRNKQQYKIDDEYLNGYARLCGVYATAVYNSLSRHADFHEQKCFPSIRLIAEQHNISHPTVIKGIKELEKWGIVKIIREKDFRNRQKPNVYILVDKTNWVEKPDRVKEVYPESRVKEIYEPSKPESKSRVKEVYRKDTKFKDNTIKDTHFDSFWKEYPNKTNKKKSRELWDSKKLDCCLEEILSFIEGAKKTDRWRKGFIKAPDVFLRNENWNDDLTAYGGAKQVEVYKNKGSDLVARLTKKLNERKI